jgi:hypothetical protein
MYSLWEHLKPDDRVLLKSLMPKGWQPLDGEKPVNPVKYPSLAECERNIHKVIGEISPAHTKGIR